MTGTLPRNREHVLHVIRRQLPSFYRKTTKTLLLTFMDKNEASDHNVRIVCPRAEELSVIVNNVRCDECGSSFSNEPRLRMHVLKIHEHKSLKKTIKEDVRYHCPEITCVYALKSQRYFTTMKYLKQHYLKVHAAKKFPCTQCEKGFSTEAARLAHLRVCGVQFVCGCRRIFGTYEALLTHGKRAAHAVDEKYKKTLVGKPRMRSPTRMKLVRMASHRGTEPISILPRRAESSLLASAATTKISFDVAVQTDEVKRQRRTASPSKSVKRRESRQTQTSLSSKERRAGKTVETQTMTKSGKLPSRKMANNEKSSLSFVKDLSLNENFSSDNLFPSSPLELQHDVALQDFWEEKNASLGTQTSPDKDFLEVLSDSVTQTDLPLFYHRSEARSKSTKMTMTTKILGDNSCCAYDAGNALSRSDPMLTIDSFAPDRFSSIETQTETAMEMTTTGNFFDSDVGRNFALSSNNETQTTENFDNIEQLLYSNTCTQTCNDILPSDLGLSDIQTQTAWHELEDVAINAEAQTRLSQRRNLGNLSSRSWLNTRISHTETQTDLFAIFDEFS